jgi:hypothetical protein
MSSPGDFLRDRSSVGNKPAIVAKWAGATGESWSRTRGPTPGAETSCYKAFEAALRPELYLKWDLIEQTLMGNEKSMEFKHMIILGALICWRYDREIEKTRGSADGLFERLLTT